MDHEVERLINDRIATVNRLMGGADIHLRSIKRFYRRYNKGVGNQSDVLAHMISSISDMQEFLLLIAQNIGEVRGILAVDETKESRE